MKKAEEKIGLFPLTGIIIGAILGAGIFNLMKQMALTASAGVTILGWLIAGIGMGSLALCMVYLNEKRPDLNAGIFSYAQEGFGDYLGFNSVWGYWISVIIGNVAFGTLLFSALAYFFPVFGNGQNIPSIIGASIVLWVLHEMIISGLDKATIMNALVMLTKLIPIVIFIVCIICGFNKHIFFHDFWGTMASNSSNGSSILTQLKGTVLATIWVFIGVEGAVVFSGRAKKRSDVGKATILGFGAVALIYAAVTVLSFGIMTQSQLRNLPNPAMAYVLEAVIGKPGAVIVNIGVIITIFGAWMANTLLAEEVAYQAGLRKLFPRIFTHENKSGMPVTSTFITNIIVQILLLSFLITDQAYTLLSNLSSAVILLPYTLVALFELKVCFYEHEKVYSKNLVVGVIATVYMIWLIYAQGMMYLILTVLALLLGTIMYVYICKHYKRTIFNKYEWVVLGIFVVLFVYGLINFNTIVKL